MTETVNESQENTEPTGRRIRKVSAPSSGAMGTVSEQDKDGNVVSTSWLSKGETIELPFSTPGARLPHKSLFTVKALSPDGVLVQLPLEDQINNNVSSPDDRIGLRLYQRKGFDILMNLETGETVYCPAWDCWAPSLPQHRGACSAVHEASLYRQRDEAGMLGTGVTTTRSWQGR